MIELASWDFGDITIFDFVGDNLLDFALDAVVVRIYLLLHGVVAVLVGEVDNLRYLHVTGGFPLDLLVVHDNLGMENLLLDAFVEIVYEVFRQFLVSHVGTFLLLPHEGFEVLVNGQVLVIGGLRTEFLLHHVAKFLVHGLEVFQDAVLHHADT